jgi:nucleotide-binding universal stress UspA family protein
VIPADLAIGAEQRPGSTTMSLQIDPTPSAQWLESRPPTFVVGYDGSAEARRARQVAAGRARPSGTVVAVHATPSASEWLDSSFYDSAVTARLRREDEILGELANVDLGDVRLEVELVDGSPAEALVSAARARDALEIVVGSRGLGAIRAALGSVSHEVLRKADRPVVVVPPAASSVGRASDGEH